MMPFANWSETIRELWRLCWSMDCMEVVLGLLAPDAEFFWVASESGVFPVKLYATVYDCFLLNSVLELRFEAGLKLRLYLFVLESGWLAPTRDLFELLSLTFYPG